jgi:hypothetical protein
VQIIPSRTEEINVKDSPKQGYELEVTLLIRIFNNARNNCGDVEKAEPSEKVAERTLRRGRIERGGNSRDVDLNIGQTKNMAHYGDA